MSRSTIGSGRPAVHADRGVWGSAAATRVLDDEARDRYAWLALMSAPLLGAIAAVAATTLLVVFTVGAAAAAVWAVAGALVLLIAVQLGLIARWRGGDDAQVPQAGQLVRTTSILLVLAGLPVLVLRAEGVDVTLVAPAYAFLLVLVLFTGPWRNRLVLSGAVLFSLAALLWFGQVRAIPLVVLHLGAAALIIGATVRIAFTLSDQVLAADQARAAAELRARLLSSLLRTESLDPPEVLRASVDGLIELGFATASIRLLDHQSQTATLVEGVARARVELPREVGFVGTAIPDVVARRAPLLIQDAAADPRMRAVDHPVDAALFLPLTDGDEVVAILSGETIGRPISGDEVDAAQVLADQADQALRRARAYEADQETLAQLRTVDQRIQDFVSTLSHELRTPLTVIHGLGQTLEQRWDQLTPDARSDLLRRIDANAERLAGMLSSLIDTSALESGSFQVRAEPVGLRAVVGEVLHRAAGVTSAHPVRVAIDHDVVVDADPGLLAHVVENLLANVEKHTPPGTAVEISARVVGTRVEVTVADDGPGIPDADLPFVLDRFYRGGHIDTRPSSGLGLGLALAQDVVVAHGGTLRVAARAGEGTTFTFDLPMPVDLPGR